MSHIWIAVALFAVLDLGPSALHANAIPIYNTGVNTGGGLAPEGSPAPHWQITSTPTSSSPVAAYDVTMQSPSWVASPNSQWIGPQANEAGSLFDAAGNRSYTTTFDLTGLDPATALLSGEFAVDNCVTGVLLNGTSTSILTAGVCGDSSSYASFQSFAITTGFVGGVNTLVFLMQNAGSSGTPSGLNVLISGNANPLTVPEPGTLGLIMLGLPGFGGLWLRWRKV